MIDPGSSNKSDVANTVSAFTGMTATKELHFELYACLHLMYTSMCNFVCFLAHSIFTLIDSQNTSGINVVKLYQFFKLITLLSSLALFVDKLQCLLHWHC